MSKMVDNNEPNKLHECSTEERTTFWENKIFRGHSTRWGCCGEHARQFIFHAMA